jgi:cell wall-associated NlpC family hydrolase
VKRTVGPVFCSLATIALLPLVPLLGVAAAAASAACSGSVAGGNDTGAVTTQVEAVLSGRGAAKVKVAGLENQAEQVPNAKIVTATGVALHVPARGQVVALATALQESGLRNLAHGDRDSLGFFQQRPSEGWGTAAEILDPVHASARFYAALRQVSGWESLSIAQAAQEVQRSAYPDSYARWEPLATALQRAILPATGGKVPAEPNDGSDPLAETDSTCSEDSPNPAYGGGLPAGYVIPVDAPAQAQAAIRWALSQLGTPYQWGGHCTAPHGPDPMGCCDCSSLVQQAYGRAGIALPRTTYGQVGSGSPVSLQALSPGDLLFTEGSAGRPEHVGMYIGSGLVVHAPHTGAAVRVDALASWVPRILAARRVL